MKLKDKVIVVTGAGSGIGRALTLQLLQKGAKVAMADLNLPNLEATKALAGDSSKISAHQLDVSDRAQILALPTQVIDYYGAVDGIINNAGIIQPFINVNDLDYERIERIMNVNFYGTLYMIKAFLPYLLERPEAHIANVSSMGGFMPFPGQTLYGASKAAVKLLTEGLHAELRNTNVKVTIIFPGAVNTNIALNSGVTVPGSDKNASSNMALPADQAAAIIIRGIEKDRYRVLVGKDARIMDMLYRINPAWAARTIAKMMARMMKNEP